jgi:hypothetical protein
MRRAGLIAAACFALLAIAPIDAHAQVRDLSGGGGGIAAPASAEECRASGSPPEDRFGVMSARGDPTESPPYVRFAPIATELLRHSGAPLCHERHWCAAATGRLRRHLVASASIAAALETWPERDSRNAIYRIFGSVTRP